MGASRRLRICLVSYEFPPGGGGEGTYTLNLVRGLSRLGHSVVLLLPEGRGAGLPPLPESASVRFVGGARAPGLKVASFVLGARKALPRLARSEGLDLAHVTFDYPSLPLGLGGAGIPLVATVHHLHFVEAAEMARRRASWMASPDFARQFMLTQVERGFLRGAARVVAVSEFTRRSLLQRGVPGARLDVVRNGIDAAHFAGADGRLFRERFGLQEGRLVLFVGRLEPSKGVGDLLSAFAMLRATNRDARLVVVGRGPARHAAALRKAASACGGVTFTGYLGGETLRSAYAAASVVVLPSLMEGMGVTLLEAMAASRPCVATRVGGVPELVEDGRTGLLVGPGNPPSLAKAIVALLEDPRRAEAMGEEGRRVVEERFTVEAMASGTESSYLTALDARAATASVK